jgi:hypothetical protein
MNGAVPQVAKIKLKVGSIELEYEGDPAFLKEGLESLLVTMTDLAKVAPDLDHLPEDDEHGDVISGTATKTANGHQVATATIAAHMEARTCAELLICALANLEIVQGKSGASRAEITAQMKSATAYYKSTMQGGNLTQAFSSLTKGKKINDIGSGRYSLNATERKSLEAKIAAI